MKPTHPLITQAELENDVRILSEILVKYATRDGRHIQLRTSVHSLTKKARSNGLIEIADLIDAVWDEYIERSLDWDKEPATL